MQNQPSDIDWQKHHEEQRALYPNHGTPWTQEDEDLLAILYLDKKCDIPTLSRIFQRNERAIEIKLKRKNIFDVNL